MRTQRSGQRVKAPKQNWRTLITQRSPICKSFEYRFAIEYACDGAKRHLPNQMRQYRNKTWLVQVPELALQAQL